MADPYTQGSESITQAEHISPAKTGDNIEAKRVASYGFDGTNWGRIPLPFTKSPYDYVSIAYNSTSDVYTLKSGGSGGTTVATITLTYTDSGKGTLSSVERT